MYYLKLVLEYLDGKLFNKMGGGGAVPKWSGQSCLKQKKISCSPPTWAARWFLKNLNYYFSNIFIGKVDPVTWLSTANETFKARSEQSQSDPEILRTGLKPVRKEGLCSVCTTK